MVDLLGWIALLVCTALVAHDLHIQTRTPTP